MFIRLWDHSFVVCKTSSLQSPIEVVRIAGQCTRLSIALKTHASLPDSIDQKKSAEMLVQWWEDLWCLLADFAMSEVSLPFTQIPTRHNIVYLINCVGSCLCSILEYTKGTMLGIYGTNSRAISVGTRHHCVRWKRADKTYKAKRSVWRCLFSLYIGCLSRCNFSIDSRCGSMDVNGLISLRRVEVKEWL